MNAAIGLTLIAIVFVLLAPLPVFATDITIIEVEVNPQDKDERNDWVRLFNPFSEPASLWRWELASTQGQNPGDISFRTLPACAELKIIFSNQIIDNGLEVLLLKDRFGNTVDQILLTQNENNDKTTWTKESPSCVSTPREKPPFQEKYPDIGCPFDYQYLWSDDLCYPSPEPVGMGSYENERYDFFFNIPMDWRYNEDLIIEEESFQVIMFPYEFTHKAIQESGEEVGLAELLTGLPFVISSPLIYVQFENISQENVPQLNERTLKEYALEKIRLVDPNARIINSNVETDSWGWTVSIEYVFPLKTESGRGLPYHAEDTTYFFKDRESYIVGYGTVEENYEAYYPVYENVLDTMVIKGVVVPEFQEIALLILASSIVMIVVFTRKFNLPVLNKL